jgi:ABC-2 type transport system ATP-binding protein
MKVSKDMDNTEINFSGEKGSGEVSENYEASENKIMVKIDHLSKKYINANKYSVEDLCLEIREGEIFGFLGQNGAGKSTTIKCLTGIYPFSEGEITVCGHSIKEDGINAKLNIGYVPDNHSVYERLTGREYVNYIADLYGVPKKDRDARFQEYLEAFKLAYAIDRQIKGYSHGMKQKICIIAALIHQPRLWVLDEPMVGLDPQSIFEIIDRIKQHCERGNTVFFSSHNIDLVAKLCHRVAIINSGKLCEVIDLTESDNRKTLEDTFKRYTM